MFSITCFHANSILFLISLRATTHSFFLFLLLFSSIHHCLCRHHTIVSFTRCNKWSSHSYCHLAVSLYRHITVFFTDISPPHNLIILSSHYIDASQCQDNEGMSQTQSDISVTNQPSTITNIINQCIKLKLR